VRLMMEAMSLLKARQDDGVPGQVDGR